MRKNLLVDASVTFDNFENSKMLDILAVHQITIRNSDESARVWFCNTLSTLSSDLIEHQEIKVADLEFGSDVPVSMDIKIVGEDAKYFAVKGRSIYTMCAGQSLGIASGFLSISLVIDWPAGSNLGTQFLTHTVSIFGNGEVPRLLLADPVQFISFDGSSVSGTKVTDLVLSNNLSSSEICLAGPDADKFYIEGNKVFVKNAMFNDKLLSDDIVLIVAAYKTIQEKRYEPKAMQTAPVLMSIESYPLMYVETQAAISVSDTILALSPGSGVVSSAYVTIVDGYDMGNDYLVMVDQSNEHNGSSHSNNDEQLDQFVDFDSQRGILRITGVGSVSQYVNLLRSIKYFNAGDDVDGDTRSIEITIEDAGICSNVLKRDLFVVPARYSADYTDSINQFNDSVYIEDFESLIVDQDLMLGILKNNTSGKILLDDASVFQITEPPPGVEIYVNNESVNTFTLHDIRKNSVVLKHDGSNRKGGTLFMEVDNGDEAIFALTLHVFVYAEGKQSPGSVCWNDGGKRVDMAHSRDANENHHEFINKNKIAANTEFPIDKKDVTKRSDSPIKKFAAAISPVRAERKNMMFWNKSMFQDVLPSNLELLTSLQLPHLPALIHVYQKTPSVFELADMIVQHTGGSPESIGYRSELLTTLLELNPLVLSVDATQWSDWFSSNYLYSAGKDELRHSFEDCAASLLGEGVCQSVVTSNSTDDVSNEFIAWLLSSGHLLSVLQTHPDLYSRAA